MKSAPAKKNGLRARKRRETRQRIAKTGLKLFVRKGYDATTLEAIAAAAGISARTFFYYFKTKDEVLQFWQGSGCCGAARPADPGALEEAGPGRRGSPVPLETRVAIRNQELDRR